jgi:hypothetical protein
LNWTRIFDQVSRFQIKSITDSLFRYGIYILTLGTVSSVFKSPIWVTIFLFSVGGVFEFIGLIFYCFFAVKNPDYLRSENFQIRKQSIDILGDKDNILNPNAKNITLIASPYSNEHGGSDITINSDDNV